MGSSGWIGDDGRGRCPHCGDSVCFERVLAGALGPLNGEAPAIGVCPSCKKPVVDWVWQGVAPGEVYPREVRRLGIYPHARTVKLPAEVPKDIARDYQEAVAVALSSTRASAALARRGLQTALRERGFKAPSKKLNDEIDLALKDPRTSSTLGEKLRFVQHVGNDAAHPNLDYLGDFIEVTPEDLEVIIAALDEFFDTYYVKPAKHAAVMKAREQRKKGP